MFQPGRTRSVALGSATAYIGSMRTFALLIALLALLGATVWFAVSAWTSIEGPPMPAIGWMALVGGVSVSLVLGCGLMALVFYSHRNGYDEIDDFRPRQD
jgi:hypothetical protein